MVMVFMPMAMMVSVIMVMVPVMMMVTGQQPGTGEVHGKPDHRHHGRLSELDRNRVHQANDALVADQQGDQGQDDRAGERRELANLAGPEREARIVFAWSEPTA